MDNLDPTRHLLTQFTWRYEAAWTLLWSLSYVETLAWPSAICDAAAAVAPLANADRETFVAGAVLRPLADILDAADLVYRQHWATRNAKLKGEPIPDSLNDDVIVERHYALNWLIGYMGEDWDDITTDT